MSANDPPKRVVVRRTEDPLLVTTFRLTPEERYFWTNYIGGQRTRDWVESLIDEEGPQMRAFLEQMRDKRLRAERQEGGYSPKNASDSLRMRPVG